MQRYPSRRQRVWNGDTSVKAGLVIRPGSFRGLWRQRIAIKVANTRYILDFCERNCVNESLIYDVKGSFYIVGVLVLDVIHFLMYINEHNMNWTNAPSPSICNWKHFEATIVEWKRHLSLTSVKELSRRIRIFFQIQFFSILYFPPTSFFYYPKLQLLTVVTEKSAAFEMWRYVRPLFFACARSLWDSCDSLAKNAPDFAASRVATPPPRHLNKNVITDIL